MQKYVFETKEQMGAAAAACAAEKIQQAIDKQHQANLVLASGTSQLDTLKRLVAADIDWSRVNVFHLDEYIGIPKEHRGSSRRFIQDHLIDRVGRLKSVHLICGDAPNPEQECRRLESIIASAPIDVALLGIGENGHLAFNDPPADFQTEAAFRVVTLDQCCRHQQVEEGWFASLDEVPLQAITMTIHQILKSRSLVVSVPERRKASAARLTLVYDVSPMRPASVLQSHPDCAVFMDQSAAAFQQPF